MEKIKLFVVKVGDKYLTNGTTESQRKPPLSVNLAAAKLFPSRESATSKLARIANKVCRASFKVATIVPGTLTVDPELGNRVPNGWSCIEGQDTYEAHLSDPSHGEATKRAETPEEAVELAFRELATSWMGTYEQENWPADEPMFDGEIRNEIEVWWHNRLWAMIGVVRKIDG